jgi:hypothetical protein
VYATGKRFAAKIRYGGKQHSLGYFDTKEEAAFAYDKKARQRGQDKLLNYESIAAAEEAAAAQAEIFADALCVGPQKLKPRPASGFYGVSANKKQWQAQIRYDSKQHNLGGYNTKQEAALAYDRAARQSGKDKPLNYDSIEAAEEAAAQARSEHTLVHPRQTRPRPPSGFYGVNAKGKKRWAAQIYYGNKKHNLGTFDTKQEAALAYDMAARQRQEEKPLNYESIKAAEEAAAQAQAGHTLVHNFCAGPPKPKPRPPAGFYGASANDTRWQVDIRYDSKQHCLGSFDTKQEAALAYATEARQHGEDKPLNIDSIKAAEGEAASQVQPGV